MISFSTYQQTERGATKVEYIVLCAFLSVVMFAAFPNLSATFFEAAWLMNAGAPGCPILGSGAGPESENNAQAAVGGVENSEVQPQCGPDTKGEGVVGEENPSLNLPDNWVSR